MPPTACATALAKLISTAHFFKPAPYLSIICAVGSVNFSFSSFVNSIRLARSAGQASAIRPTMRVMAAIESQIGGTKSRGNFSDSDVELVSPRRSGLEAMAVLSLAMVAGRVLERSIEPSSFKANDRRDFRSSCGSGSGSGAGAVLALGIGSLKWNTETLFFKGHYP